MSLKHKILNETAKLVKNIGIKSYFDDEKGLICLNNSRQIYEKLNFTIKQLDNILNNIISLEAIFNKNIIDNLCAIIGGLKYLRSMLNYTYNKLYFPNLEILSSIVKYLLKKINSIKTKHIKLKGSIQPSSDTDEIVGINIKVFLIENIKEMFTKSKTCNILKNKNLNVGNKKYLYQEYIFELYTLYYNFNEDQLENFFIAFSYTNSCPTVVMYICYTSGKVKKIKIKSFIKFLTEKIIENNLFYKISKKLNDKSLFNRELSDISIFNKKNKRISYTINDELILKIKKSKKFAKNFIMCPICKEKNHFDKLTKMYIEEKKKFKIIKETIKNLKNQEKQVGVLCCNCFRKFFSDQN